MHAEERLTPTLLPGERILWAGSSSPLRVAAATLLFAVPGFLLIAMGFLAYGSGIRALVAAVGMEDVAPEMSITVGGAVLTLLMVWAGLMQLARAARFPPRAFDDACVTESRIIVRRFRSRGATYWMPCRDVRSVRSEPFSLRIPLDGKDDFLIVGVADDGAVHSAIAESVLACKARPPLSFAA